MPKPYSSGIAAIPKRPLHACPFQTLPFRCNQTSPRQVVYKSPTPREAKVISVKRLPKQATSGSMVASPPKQATIPSEQNTSEVEAPVGLTSGG